MAACVCELFVCVGEWVDVTSTCVCVCVKQDVHQPVDQKQASQQLFPSMKFVTPKKKPQSGYSRFPSTLCVSSIPACFQRAAAHIWII